MRKFTFWNENGDEKETEQVSLKKAVRDSFEAISKIK